ASIGFECGYNIQEPSHLVIWEAQYGDFINGAQVILDQFVTSGRAKWGLKPSLVFFLRHHPASRQLHDCSTIFPPASSSGGAAASGSVAPVRTDAKEPASQSDD